jgi:hypothetical protein
MGTAARRGRPLAASGARPAASRASRSGDGFGGLGWGRPGSQDPAAALESCSRVPSGPCRAGRLLYSAGLARVGTLSPNPAAARPRVPGCCKGSWVGTKRDRSPAGPNPAAARGPVAHAPCVERSLKLVPSSTGLRRVGVERSLKLVPSSVLSRQSVLLSDCVRSPGRAWATAATRTTWLSLLR